MPPKYCESIINLGFIWITTQAQDHVNQTPQICVPNLTLWWCHSSNVSSNTIYTFRQNTGIMGRELNTLSKFILQQNIQSKIGEDLISTYNPELANIHCIYHLLLKLMLEQNNNFLCNGMPITYCWSQMFGICNRQLYMKSTGASASMCGDILCILWAAICSSLNIMDGNADNNSEYKYKEFNAVVLLIHFIKWFVDWERPTTKNQIRQSALLMDLVISLLAIFSSKKKTGHNLFHWYTKSVSIFSKTFLRILFGKLQCPNTPTPGYCRRKNKTATAIWKQRLNFKHQIWVHHTRYATAKLPSQGGNSNYY